MILLWECHIYFIRLSVISVYDIINNNCIIVLFSNAVISNEKLGPTEFSCELFQCSNNTSFFFFKYTYQSWLLNTYFNNILYLDLNILKMCCQKNYKLILIIDWVHVALCIFVPARAFPNPILCSYLFDNSLKRVGNEQ